MKIQKTNISLKTQYISQYSALIIQTAALKDFTTFVMGGDLIFSLKPIPS